jgi:ATP-dependent DNA helicase RecQ
VGLVVIDEAHCISDWGFDFRPDYQRLARALLSTPTPPCWPPPPPPTARHGRRREASSGSDTVTFRGTLARTSLRLSVVPGLSPLERYAWVADALDTCPGRASSTCSPSPRPSGWPLPARMRHEVAPYTGQLDADARLDVEERLRHNQVKAVVATSALGMGYDKPDLGFCLHVGSPATPVAYYQQVGRAGRAVDHADAVLLGRSSDERIWEYFATASIPDPRDARTLRRARARAPFARRVREPTGIRRGRLEALLKILAVDGVVAKDGSAVGRHRASRTCTTRQVGRARRTRRARPT